VPIMANEEKQSVDDPVMTNTASADEITGTRARVLCAEGLLEQFAIADLRQSLAFTPRVAFRVLSQFGYLIQSRIRIECVSGSIKRIR
jgi:hypothetical protein